MIIRPWAEFTSDLPNDLVEDDDLGFTEYGGRSVAYAVAELLTGLGADVNPPENAGEHGWECSFTYKGRRLWFQVTLIEGYTLLVEDISFGLGKLFGRPHPLYLEALNAVADALAADPRFHDVRWYVSDDVLSGAKGAARPVDAG